MLSQVPVRHGRHSSPAGSWPGGFLPGDGQHRYRVGGPPGILSIQPQYWAVLLYQRMLVAIVVPGGAGPLAHLQRPASCWQKLAQASASTFAYQWATPRVVSPFLIRQEKDLQRAKTPWWQSAADLPDSPL